MGILDDINPLKDDGPVAPVTDGAATEVTQRDGLVARDERPDGRDDTETQQQEQQQI